jgi:hypothetical protein
MPFTSVKYNLKLSKVGITISKITFGDQSKSGAALAADYLPDDNTFAGTIDNVFCDCHQILVAVEGDGPAGGYTDLTGKLCGGKTLIDEPLRMKEENGIYNYHTITLLA